MVFDNILKLQNQLTDKYVVVDANRPELKRFSGLTGTVKTVNFSGRALVQFDGHNNIGWYDIDPAFLKVIDAPLPKAEKAEKKPAAAPKAEAAPAAKPAAKSAADILAAAKAGAKPAAAAPAAPAAKPAGKMSAADILAAAKGGKAAAPAAEKPAAEAKPAAPAKKMTPAEILAAASGKAPAAPAAKPVEKAPPAKVESPPPAPPAPEPVAEAPAGGGGVKSMLGKFKTNAEIIAFLRK